MITGDHATTAAAIAGQINLSNEEIPFVINGKALTDMSDDDLAEQIQKTVVFARVSPTACLLQMVKYLPSGITLIVSPPALGVIDIL
jgi:magnesium-transporting ATPase (P-type)